MNSTRWPKGRLYHLHESVPTILAKAVILVTVKSCWALRLARSDRVDAVCDYSTQYGLCKWWTVQGDRRTSCVIYTKVFLRFSPKLRFSLQLNPVEHYDWCKERVAIICDYSMLEGIGTLVCLILKTDENQFKMNRNADCKIKLDK